MLHSRLIHYIDEVARAGSIRRAAERLNVASSSINRQIIAYEEALGQRIFERLPRGVRLTASGEMLVEHIRATLKEHERLLSRYADMKGMRRTTISVATLEALTADVIAQVANRFLQRFPFTRIQVESVPAAQISTTVAGGDAMLGLGFDLQVIPNIRMLCSVPCSLGVVVGSQHPLATSVTLRLSDCVGHAFAMPSTPLTLRQILDRAITRANVTLHPVMETNSIDLLKRLVSMSNVATILTRADVEMDRLSGHLVFIPIVGGRNEVQNLTLIQRESASLSPAVALFAEELAAFVQQIGDR
jgi:DNA-binding transcriptional LysR family regulator